MIVLLVITDGRDDVLAETMASLAADLTGPIARRVLYDDTGDPAHAHALRRTYPTFEVVQHPAGRQGFGGAIRTAWAHIGTGPERFVFHAEDDFTLNCPLDLTPLMATLDACPHIAQMALRRQAWNPEERAAGGVVERNPDAFSEVRDGPDVWLEHRLFLTTNPSLYRRELCQQGWPEGERSEGVMTHRLLEDPDLRFAYWGARSSAPWVHHIGKERAGVGY